MQAKIMGLIKNLHITSRTHYRKVFYNVIIDRPIFVVGLQGGGLTLIRRILSRAPNMVFVCGNSNTWYANDEMQNELSLILPEEFRLFNCRFFGQNGFFRGGWLFGTDKYIDHFRKIDRDVTPELKSSFISILKDIIVKNAISLEGCRFIDKSQSYGLKIKFLTKILEEFNPKFLVVTRNPYIACTKATQKPALSLLDCSPLDKLGLAAQHYYNCMSAMINDANGNVYLMKFEDFLDDPTAAIHECCSFLELEYSEGMLPSPNDNYQGGKWYPIRMDINVEWLDRIGSEEVKIINDKCGDLISKLGYELL